LSRILIDGGTIITMDEDRNGEGGIIEDGQILIEGQKIKKISEDRNEEIVKADRVIKARNHIVMPGFINGHTHAGMTMLRSYADDMPLMKWLEEAIWPAEQKLTPDDIYWGSLLAIIEMIRAGITTFADMYFEMDRVAEAVEKSGIRANLSRGLIGIDSEADKSLAEAEEFIHKWNNKTDRITLALGPHAPYTCPPPFLKDISVLGKKLGVPLHIHLAETRDEVEEIREKYDMMPVEYLDNFGLLSRPIIAAHCVHLTSREIRMLGENKVGVVHNPQSNMKLSSGVSPIIELMEERVPLALGTDGAASNNNLDLFEEMRTAAFLQKIMKKDPTVLPAFDVLNMATRGGAEVLNLPLLGQIKPGFYADIILINRESPHLYPGHNPVADMVYSAYPSDVDTVFVNGQVLMEKKEILTVDENRVLKAVKQRSSLLKEK